MVIIKGLQKSSVIDYPGKLCCVVFLPSCNFRCPFCHNPDLVDENRSKNIPTIPENEFFNFLEERKKWIEGVVITGGEPCLYKDLINFVKRIKEKGFSIKIDTNGSFPGMLGYLIDNKLVDYIAMDIKATFDKYSVAAGVKANLDNIKSSIGILMKSCIDYEFRITVVPSLHTEEDIIEIGKMLKGSKKIVLQQFNNKVVLDYSFSKIKPYSIEELNVMKELLRKYVKVVDVR